MKDVQKLLAVLEEQKRDLEQKGEVGMFHGMDLAIDLVKLHVGMGSILEQDIQKYMTEDVFIPQEEYDDVFSYLSRCHDNGFIPDIDHLSDKFPETEWDDLEQEVKGFARIHDLSETKILWEGDIA